MEDEREVEKEFNAWLDSIEFIRKDGSVSQARLTEDISADPEQDSTTEED